jgi:hypothetical protein
VRFSARLRASKIDGIILNTDPLPIPDRTNRAMKPMTWPLIATEPPPLLAVVDGADGDQQPGAEDHAGQDAHNR